MNLDQNLQHALENLSKAINSAVEQSLTVREAVENVRELGFEPNLALRLEIGLQEIIGIVESEEEFELDLTADDLRTLQRMKIKF